VTPLENERALAAAIETVLGAPAFWRDAASTAAERVRALYGADAVGSQMAQLYGEMVATA
jgi:hypothetical protein